MGKQNTAARDFGHTRINRPLQPVLQPPEGQRLSLPLQPQQRVGTVFDQTDRQRSGAGFVEVPREDAQQGHHLEPVTAKQQRRRFGEAQCLTPPSGNPGAEPGAQAVEQVGGAGQRQPPAVAAGFFVPLSEVVDRRRQGGTFSQKRTFQPRRQAGRIGQGRQQHVQVGGGAADPVKHLGQQRLAPGGCGKVGSDIAQRQHIAGLTAPVGQQAHPRGQQAHTVNRAAQQVGGGVVVVRSQQTCIGMQHRAFAQMVEQPTVKSGGTAGFRPHHIGRRTVVEHKLMRARTQHNSDRHVRQQRLEAGLFVGEAGGFAGHRLGQGIAGFGQARGGGRGGGPEIAEIADGGLVKARVDIGMGPGAQRACQQINRSGDIDVKQKPHPGDQPQPAERPDNPGLDKGIQRLWRGEPLIGEHEAQREHRHRTGPEAREKQEHPQPQTEPCQHIPLLPGRFQPCSRRRTSARSSFSSKGLVMKPSAPSAMPFLRSIAEPRAVIIRIFTCARSGSMRMP